jgi:hypothetical protein
MTTGNDNSVPADPEPTAPHDPHAHLRRTRNQNGRFTRDMTTVRRDAAVAEHLADHPQTTYNELAELFGFSHRKDAYNAVLRAKADVARPAVSKLIDDESQELDALYTEACKILQRNHITVSHGRIVTWLNPETQQEEPLLDDGPKLTAIQTALRVRESYRKLHGLDQPSRLSIDAQQLGDEINTLLDRAAGTGPDGDTDG